MLEAVQVLDLLKGTAKPCNNLSQYQENGAQARGRRVGFGCRAGAGRQCQRRAGLPLTPAAVHRRVHGLRRQDPDAAMLLQEAGPECGLGFQCVLCNTMEYLFDV